MPATTIEMYADLLCPFAYLTAWRLRRLRERFAGRVTIVHRSLSLEYVNGAPTEKRGLDLEIPLLMAEDLKLPWRIWSAPESEWPVTVWPAFEAVKCAERQGLDLADELDWRLRHAVHAESRSIALRHVILDLAGSIEGLDLTRFTADFDSGVAKGQVIEEARTGWERLRVDGSPTLVFPSGRQESGLCLPSISVEDGRVTGVERPDCRGSACLDRLAEMIEAGIARA